VLNELQLRYNLHMPRRVRAYASLAEERYRLPVYPVLINILPPASTVIINSRYESDCLGLRASQEYRVINLWEIEAELVFQQPLLSLLPFVPILRGGNDTSIVQRAAQILRADEQLNQLEPLLSFFASFVLDMALVQQILRWDMVVLRESPWYEEILQQGVQQGVQQGLQQGVQQGLQEGLQEILQQRFGELPPGITTALQGKTVQQLKVLMNEAIAISSLEEFITHL
jgi:predicted transposase YdaD